MQPSLTLQEEELARNLKAQGKSTQEIMGALARQRTGGIEKAKPQIQQNLLSRIARDIPSDFMELGQNVTDSVKRSGQQLAGAYQDPSANFIQKVAATGPILSKSVLDVAGEAAIGYGKMLTTDEFEKAVSKKIGETGQQVMDTGAAKSIANWYDKQDDQTKFMIKNVLLPSAEVFGEAATFGAGSVATRAGGELVERGIKQAGEDIADVSNNAFRPMPDQPIISPLPPEAKDTIVRGFDVAIKPNLASKTTPVQLERYNNQVSQAVDTISNNRANLSFVDEATGETVTGRLPQNLKEFVDGMEQTKQTIFQKYDDIAAKAGEAGAQVDMIRVANQLDEIINSRSLGVANPDSIRYAQDVRDRLTRTGTLSTLDAQDVIRNYNNSLDAFYRNPTPEGLTRNAVDALVANNLRRALDDEIEAMTGAQYQALKNDYAALKAIERDVMRAYNRDARRNQKGLIDFTDVLTGGQVVSGILSMNPAAIGQGLAGKAISTAIKMINDPNRKVKQIFEEAGRYRRPDAGAQAPTRRQLPATQPGSPRSQVESGRAIAVGGQTDRGRVETGITERTREGAVRRSDSDKVPTEVEKVIKEDINAIEQAISEIDASINALRGNDNLVRNNDGTYYRFKTLPSWVPEGMRDGNKLAQAIKNIEKGNTPKPDTELSRIQQMVQDHVDMRVAEIKKENSTKTQGVFSNDAPFAIALLAGGSYYLYTSDGELAPILGVAAMASPVGRRALAKQGQKVAKLSDNTADETLKALSKFDSTPFTARVSTNMSLTGQLDQLQLTNADANVRLDQLKAKNESRPLSKDEIVEARLLLELTGDLKPFTAGATPNLDPKNFKNAEEYVEAFNTKSPDYAVGDGTAHSAPTRDGYNAPATDLTKIYPKDVYEKGIEYYGSGFPDLDSQAMSILREIKDKPNTKVTIYRSVLDNSFTAKQLQKDALAALKQKEELGFFTSTNNKAVEMLEAKYRDPEGGYRIPFDDAKKAIEDDLRKLVDSTEKEIADSKIEMNPGDWVTLTRGYAKMHGEDNLNGKYKIITKKVFADEIFTDANSLQEFGYDPRPLKTRTQLIDEWNKANGKD